MAQVTRLPARKPSAAELRKAARIWRALERAARNAKRRPITLAQVRL